MDFFQVFQGAIGAQRDKCNIERAAKKKQSSCVHTVQMSNIADSKRLVMYNKMDICMYITLYKHVNFFFKYTYV